MKEEDKKENNNKAVIFFLVLFALGVAYRFIDHAPNFSPLAAISLFAGFYFRRHWTSLLPIAILLVSDIFIGFYDWKLMLAVYFSFILIGLMGILMRKNKSVITLVGCSLAGSFLFFVLTNFAVWAFGQWYPHNFQGLRECYMMAIPFFRNTLMGDLFYASVIFGCYELLVQPKERLVFLYNRAILTK